MSNNRTFQLISHASKRFLHVIHEHLKQPLLPHLAEGKAGFVPWKDPRVQIYTDIDGKECIGKENIHKNFII